MNLLKTPLRRATALAAGALIGAAGAVAFAAPASAHTSEITHDTKCQKNGTWTVTWTITAHNAEIEGTVTELDILPAGSTIDGIEVYSVLPKDAPLVGVQTLSDDVEGAAVAYKIEWFQKNKAKNGGGENPKDSGHDIAKRPRKCTPESPSPSPSPTTVSAAKLRVRPPLTTLVTRLTAIIFSFRPSSLPSVGARG